VRPWDALGLSRRLREQRRTLHLGRGRAG
jgi:hypothetical protein